MVAVFSGALRILSIAVYLLSWVANGEWMQAISTGRRWGDIGNASNDGDDSSSNTTPLAYNKPAFLTWYAYCHLVLAWIPVAIYVVSVRHRKRVQPSSKYDEKRTNTTSIVSAMSMRTRLRTVFVAPLRKIFMDLSVYMTTVWSKNLEDFWSSWWKCLTFNYILMGLNVLWIVGLTQGISVPMSNAIYQSQIPATVLLSMYYDEERLQEEKGGRNKEVDDEGEENYQKQNLQRRPRERRQHWRRVLVGTMISSVGIGMIVIPPLLASGNNDVTSTHEESATASSSTSSSSFLGVFVTFLSAMIGAVYQVAWKVLMDEKDEHRGDRDEGDDTSATEMVHLIDPNVVDEEEGRQLLTETPQDSRLIRRGNEYQTANTARSSNDNAVKERGLINTFATLGVMGICNILFGWPVLLLLHWSSIETIDLKPVPRLWKVLMINSLIETLFDTSCAVAIYMTSPVVTSITAPLTIPISFFWDVLFRRADDHDAVNSSSSSSNNTNDNLWLVLLGSILIVIGVVRIEMKPKPSPPPQAANYNIKASCYV